MLVRANCQIQKFHTVPVPLVWTIKTVMCRNQYKITVFSTAMKICKSLENSRKTVSTGSENVYYGLRGNGKERHCTDMLKVN
jgi:hypothetical protein